MRSNTSIGLCLLTLLQISGCCGRGMVAGPGRSNAATTISATTNPVPSFDAASVGRDVILLGRCHRPLGQVMLLTGIVVEGPFKGYEGGPNMIVQRIDGVATQEYIRVPLEASTFKQDKPRDPNYRAPLFYVAGKTYELRGFETGVFVGTPAGADDGVPIQTTGYHMQTEFERTWSAKPRMVDPITFSPAEFLNQCALLSGTAANVGGHGYLIGDGWRLLSVDDGSPWPQWMTGKSAEVDGIVRAGSRGEFRAEHAARRLIQLADQVGHRVELHGVLRQSYEEGAWQGILRYRGDEILVRHLAECPGWSNQLAWTPVVIRGTLTGKASTSPTGGIGWFINEPSWAPLPRLRSSETSTEAW